MATNKHIQDNINAKYDFQPKTYWIADVKEQAGLPVRRAWNRANDERQSLACLRKWMQSWMR